MDRLRLPWFLPGSELQLNLTLYMPSVKWTLHLMMQELQRFMLYNPGKSSLVPFSYMLFRYCTYE